MLQDAGALSYAGQGDQLGGCDGTLVQQNASRDSGTGQPGAPGDHRRVRHHGRHVGGGQMASPATKCVRGGRVRFYQGRRAMVTSGSSDGGTGLVLDGWFPFDPVYRHDDAAW